MVGRCGERWYESKIVCQWDWIRISASCSVGPNLVPLLEAMAESAKLCGPERL